MQPLDLLTGSHLLQYMMEDQPELLQAKRLTDVIIGMVLHRLHGAANLTVAGHDDDWRTFGAPDPLQDLDAVYVGQDQV